MSAQPSEGFIIPEALADGIAEVYEDERLARIEQKLDAVLEVASQLSTLAEGLLPILAEVEAKGPMALFGMMMKGPKK